MTFTKPESELHQWQWRFVKNGKEMVGDIIDKTSWHFLRVSLWLISYMTIDVPPHTLIFSLIFNSSYTILSLNCITAVQIKFICNGKLIMEWIPPSPILFKTQHVILAFCLFFIMKVPYCFFVNITCVCCMNASTRRAIRLDSLPL